jgi:phosphatidylglycerophosphatase A
MKSSKKIVFTRHEMLALNIEILKKRGVTVNDIALISFQQQSKYSSQVTMDLCTESVEKILSIRDVFHHVQLACEIDRLTEEGMFQGPIQDILYEDYGLFGIDETVGLDVAGLYGTIGQTNFGDIDVNKTGIVQKLNDLGKTEGQVHTFLDDIVGAIAAAASTRVAQITHEENAQNEPSEEDLFDLIKE